MVVCTSSGYVIDHKSSRCSSIVATSHRPVRQKVVWRRGTETHAINIGVVAKINVNFKQYTINSDRKFGEGKRDTRHKIQVFLHQFRGTLWNFTEISPGLRCPRSAA